MATVLSSDFVGSGNLSRLRNSSCLFFKIVDNAHFLLCSKDFRNRCAGLFVFNCLVTFLFGNCLIRWRKAFMIGPSRAALEFFLNMKGWEAEDEVDDPHVKYCFLNSHFLFLSGRRTF